MVKPKNEKTWNVKLQDLAKDLIARRGTPIDERWYVMEVKPARRYRTGDGHGGSELQWTREVHSKVSPYFGTRQEAEKWAEGFEPDEGNRFEFKKQTLYERVVREWH